MGKDLKTRIQRMRFKKIDAHLGDILKINENMSLKFEKIAEDVGPIWHEILATPPNREAEDGHFIQVTDDVWFVFEKGNWRMMNNSEHVEASRHVYMNNVKNGDHFSRP